MPTQVETVVLNGFWSEFQVDVLPKNGDVYFAFLGRVIRKPLCVIEKLLYIGPRYINNEDVLPRDKLREYCGEEVLDGELFYMSGSMSTRGIDNELLQDILKAHFFAEGMDNVTARLHGPIVVELVGKIPRLFSGSERIEINVDGNTNKEVK